MPTVKVAQAYLDEIERICKPDDDDMYPTVGDSVTKHWGRGGMVPDRTLPLFGYCHPIGAQFAGPCQYGCLTMIHDPQKSREVVDAHGAPVADLTEEIKKDRKIASAPHRILPKRLAYLSYPLTDKQAARVRKRLLHYAVWQTRLRLRFKDVPRKQLKIRRVKC